MLNLRSKNPPGSPTAKLLKRDEAPSHGKQVLIVVSRLRLKTLHPFLFSGSFSKLGLCSSSLRSFLFSSATPQCTFTLSPARWIRCNLYHLLYQPLTLNPFNSLFMQKHLVSKISDNIVKNFPWQVWALFSYLCLWI